MISASSPILSHLASSNRVAQIGLGRSQARLAHSGDSLESTRQSGDSGQFSFATRLSGKTRASQNHMRNLQNSTTYVQMQQAGLEKARQIFERISVLATQATDPFMTNSQRSMLNEEMDGLKSELENLRTADFNGKYLYDDLASYTVQSIDFGDDLDETQTPAESNVYQAFYKNRTRDVNRWSSTKDVLYSSGRITLEVNGGGHGERYYVKQGETILFDTGQWWETRGHAYQYDFDKFIIDFSPGKDTTFSFVRMDTAGSEDTRISGVTASPNGSFDNRSYFESQLGGATDYSEPFMNAGQVTTNPATTDSSIISVVVESTSLFQIKASYEQTGPTNYQTVGELGANDAVTLEPVGFGTMTGMGVATLADAKATLTSVLEEMKGIGIQTGKLGANLTLIEEAYNLAGDRVAAGQVSLLRMSEEDFTDSSMEYAMKKIQADGNVALLSQAKEMSSKIYNLLW
tara:strand:- start:903 stop:2285 length:1383 start_codon:yes stop_codon:yes gene_type:complete